MVALDKPVHLSDNLGRHVWPHWSRLTGTNATGSRFQSQLTGTKNSNRTAGGLQLTPQEPHLLSLPWDKQPVR
jgi:hypothetical protein